MSANIYWEPVPTKKRDVPCSAPSRFIESLKAAGIPIPGEITNADLSALRGMAMVWGGERENNPYETLIDAVEQHDVIRVYAEY